jgi:hypothetical protein
LQDEIWADFPNSSTGNKPRAQELRGVGRFDHCDQSVETQGEDISADADARRVAVAYPRRPAAQLASNYGR